MPGRQSLQLPAVVETTSEQATEAVGEALAHRLTAGDVVALVGPLGAGKTCFTRGLARGLGAGEPVASPTFALVREYRGRVAVRHVDLYRLEPAEIEELDWRDLFYGSGVAVVEWADKGRRFLPAGHYLVEIRPDQADDPGRRLISIAGPAGRPEGAAPSAPGFAEAESRVLCLPADLLPRESPSKALAIDTSTRARSLAALRDGIIHETYWPPGLGELQAEDLAAGVRVLLRQAGLGPRDLELVAVTLGPGSFTGVKVGLASAKALAYALRCPLVGVGTLDVLAAGVLVTGVQAAGRLGGQPGADGAPSRPDAALALLDAKRGEIFGAAYLGEAPGGENHHLNPIAAPGSEPYLAGAEEEVLTRLGATLGPGRGRLVVLTGDWAARVSSRGLEALRAAAPGWEMGVRPSGPESPRASDLLLLARARLMSPGQIARGVRQSAGNDPFSLQPLYLRGPGVAEPPQAAAGKSGVLP